MSEHSTYDACSEKVNDAEMAVGREPFAFEGGAECYSDQVRRMGGHSSEDDLGRGADNSDFRRPSSWMDPIGQVPPEEPELPAAKPPHNQDIGKRGEDAAARYLERRGYEILARNWKCRHGEADIIARDECTLVFVEVKTRTNCDHGLPEEAVTPAKRNRYERIAASFLKEYPCSEMAIRFDVVGLLVIAEDRAMIKHHLNAFGMA